MSLNKIEQPESRSLAKLAEDINDLYRTHPLARFAVKFFPMPLGALDAAFVAHWTNRQKSREKTFFEVLSHSGSVITEEMLHNNEFIHAFEITYKASLNTRSSEKIHRFAQLFTNTYLNSGDLPNADESDLFEERLSIADELSDREFKLLTILYDFESKFPLDKDLLSTQNAVELYLRRATMFWSVFLQTVESQLHIPQDEIPGTLARLNRTGLYQTITGAFVDYVGDKGVLTRNFYTFIDAISAKDDENHSSS